MKNRLTATYPYIRDENIVPLVVRVYTVCFVKWVDIALFCFILNQSGQMWIKENNNNNFSGLNVFFKALNFRFWQVSQSFDFINIAGKPGKFTSILFQFYYNDE